MSKKTAKRYDDYLPGETRQQYVTRRRTENAKRENRNIWGKWWQGTKARPGTREYKRFMTKPQVSNHIKRLNEAYPTGDATFLEKYGMRKHSECQPEIGDNHV